eukprot:gene12754-16996_t
MPAGVAAFWSELGFDPCDVEAGLRPGRIALSAIGDVDARPLGALLERTGLAVGFSPAVIDADIERTDDLHVVMTDDYLRPELAAINRAALRSGRAWMLVRPVGSVVWLGPVFEPGATGCWQCLAQRLAGNAEIKTSILRQRDITDMAGCLPTARPAYALAIDAALNWTAIEIAKWVVARATEGRASQDGRSPTLRGGILTFDHVTHSVQRHALPHRPQCPAWAFETHIVPSQIRIPQRLRPAAIETEAPPQPPVGSAGIEVAQAEHSTAQLQVCAERL